MKFEGFRAPRSNENLHPTGSQTSPSQSAAREKQFQIFEFTVPLPTPSGGRPLQWFSRADNVPCQRGRRAEDLPENASLEAYLEEKSVMGTRGWSSRSYPGTEIYDGASRQVLQASTISREKWNSRVDRLMEPWLEIDERGGEDQMLNDEVKNRAERTLGKNLERFINDRAGSKLLVCPQTIYGWNLTLVLDQIRALIPEETSSTTSPQDHEPASISHITISVDAPPPHLVIRALSRPDMLAYRIFGIDGLAFLGIFLPLAFLFAGDMIVLHKCELRQCGTDENPGPLHSWIFWLVHLLVSAFVWLAIKPLWPSRIHDGVGVAWPLKTLRPQVGVEASRKRDQEVESGVDELEWVDKHKELLKRAIKERRNGDLRREWPEE